MVQQETRPTARIYSLIRTGPAAIGLRLVDQIARMVTGAPVRTLSQVTPQLYVGGQHRRRGLEKMAALGITTVVNMREAHHDDQAKGAALSRYLHLPTRDNTPPAVEDLQRGADFIAAEIESGGVVYVHCGVGVGRAPIMAAAYLVSAGLTPDEALAKIRAVRPFVHPTPGQRKRLRQFAEHLKANGQKM